MHTTAIVVHASSATHPLIEIALNTRPPLTGADCIVGSDDPEPLGHGPPFDGDLTTHLGVLTNSGRDLVGNLA